MIRQFTFKNKLFHEGTLIWEVFGKFLLKTVAQEPKPRPPRIHASFVQSSLLYQKKASLNFTLECSSVYIYRLDKLEGFWQWMSRHPPYMVQMSSKQGRHSRSWSLLSCFLSIFWLYSISRLPLHFVVFAVMIYVMYI